jgi:hypothetical protein
MKTPYLSQQFLLHQAPKETHILVAQDHHLHPEAADLFTEL